VKSVGPNAFKVTFSEPVDLTTAQATASYSVNNGQYFVKSATRTSLTEVTVELYSTLATGEYDVKVSSVKDLAGFKVADTTLKLSQVEDKEAPTVTKVLEATPNKIVLEMNEDVSLTDATELNLYDNIYHTNATNTVSDITVEGKKVTLTFSDQKALPKGGTAYLIIEKDVFKDGWGNKNVQYASNVTVTVDTTKPTLVKAEATSDKVIKLTFSEDVEETISETPANYTVLDSTGKKVTNTFVAERSATDSKVVTLTTATALTGGSYSVAVENIEDLAKNVLDKVTQSVTLTDATAPTVNAAAVLYGDKNIIKVSFSEAMATTGAGSILELGNYIIDGKYLNTTKSKITVADNGKAVLIDYTDAAAAGELTVTSGEELTVGKVADASGNFTTAFTTTVTATTATTIGISKVEATGTNTVKVYLTDALSKFEADDFVLKASATTLTPGSVAFENVDGKGVITYTLQTADALGTNGKKASSDAITVETAAANINSVNAFGVKVTASHATVTAADKIVATVEKWNHDNNDATATVYDVRATLTDGDNDGKADTTETVTIKVNYSEALDGDTLSKLAFTVEGFNVASVALDTDTSVVVITATAKVNDTALTTATTVTQVMNITDEVGNVILSGTAYKVSTVQ
jgi:trimeric autotransporter adhesin